MKQNKKTSTEKNGREADEEKKIPNRREIKNKEEGDEKRSKKKRGKEEKGAR